MGEIKRVQKRHLLKDLGKQEQILKIFTMQEKQLLIFFYEYTSRASEARRQAKKGTGLKILSHKQMIQRLPIALAQIKAGNNSESLLNEIRQIIYSLYQPKEITKKVYHNIIKSIKV